MSLDHRSVLNVGDAGYFIYMITGKNNFKRSAMARLATRRRNGRIYIVNISIVGCST